MVIDITHQVDVLFTLFALALGLDLFVSGFCVLRDKNIEHTPKFIGFLFLKAIERNIKILEGRKYSKKPLTRLARRMFTLKFFGYDLIIGGLSLVILCLFLFSSK